MGANFDVGTGWVSIVPKMGDFSQVRKQIDKAVVSPSGSWGEKMGGKITSGLKKTMKAGAVATTAAAGVSAGKAFSDGFNRLASTDKAEKALEGLGYKGKDIDQIMGNVNKSIEGTSFLMGDTAQVASVMLSSGIKPGQDLQDTLSRVADSAAHSGVSMGEMGSIWSKVAARGHVDGEVMAQLMDRGIGLQQKLADQMGVTKEEVTDMISEGKVSFEDFSDAMNDMFDGAAQKQRETFKGSFDTMAAFASHVTAAFIQPFYEGMIPVFNALSDGFERITPQIGVFAEQLSDKIAPIFDHLADDVIPKMFDAISNIDFDSVMNSFTSMGNLAVQAWPAVEQLGSSVAQLLSAIAPILPSIVTAMGSIAIGSLPAIVDLLNALAPLISTVVVPAVEILTDQMAKHPGLAAAAAGGFMTWAKVIAPITRGFKAFKAGGDIIASFGPKLGPAIKGFMGFRKALGGIMKFGRIIFTGLRTLPALLAAIFDTNPIGLIVTAIAAVVAGITLFLTKTEVGHQILSKIGDAFRGFWEWIQPVFSSIGEWFAKAWGVIQQVAPYIITALITPIVIQFNILKALLTAGFNAIKLGWELLVTGIQALWENVLKPAWDAVAQALQTLWEAAIQPILNLIKQLWEAVVNSIKALIDTVLIPAWDAMSQFMSAIWNNAIQPVFNGIKAVWNMVVNGIKAIIDNILLPAWQHMSDFIKGIVDAHVRPAFDRMKQGVDQVKQWFEKAADGIKSAWNSVWETIKSIAGKIANVAYNNGIRPAWNAVSKVTGVSELPEVSFATGGVMPGYTPGRDIHTFFSPTGGTLNLSGGEAIMRPEWTRAVGGPAAVARMNATARAGKGTGLSDSFADGGVLGTIKSTAGKAWNVTDDVINKAIELGGDFANAAKKLFDGKINAVKDKLGISSGTDLAKSVAPAYLTKGADNAWNWLKDKVTAVAKKVKEHLSVGGDVNKYRGLVTRLLKEKGQPTSLVDSVLRRMQQESGGNPHAINNWDSNAAKGTPSKGLMQTIDPTFQSYKDPGFDDIWDPEANIRSSMNYAMSRYGSLSAAYDRAGGYKKGGVLPAFLRDSGGVLPNNSVAVNTSGQSEWVLNSQQMTNFAEGITYAAQHLDATAKTFSEGVEAWLNGQEERVGAPIEWGSQFLGDVLADITDDLGSPWGIDGVNAPDILDNQGRVKVAVAGTSDDPGKNALPPVEVHLNMNGDNMEVSSDDVRRGVNQALDDYQRRIEALERGVKINTFTTPMVV